MTLTLRREALWTLLGLAAVALMIWFNLIQWWFLLVFLPLGFLGGYVERWWRARTSRTNDLGDRRS